MAAGGSGSLGLPSQLFVARPVTLSQWRGARWRDVDHLDQNRLAQYDTDRNYTNRLKPIEKSPHALDIFQLPLSDEEGSLNTSRNASHLGDHDGKCSPQQRDFIASSRKPTRMLTRKPRRKRSGRHTTRLTRTKPARKHHRKKKRRKLRTSRQLTLTELASNPDRSMEVSTWTFVRQTTL